MEKPKILVVEDEGIIAKHIESSLRAMNYDVPAVVQTGEEAIDQAEKIRPDLVLMDIVLKGKVDGIQAAEQIRHRLGIPVVYLTAHIDDATLERAKIAEPFGYLVKPFQDRELQSTIEVALYKHQMEKRLKESEERARRIALENSALAEIGRIISSTPKIEDIYDQFAVAAKKLIPFDRIAVNLFDYETRSFSVAYASGEKIPEFRITACHPLKGSINQKIIKNRSPILLTPNRFEDIENEYPSVQGRWQAGFRSFLSAPLISRDRVFGGFHLLSRKPSAYIERDLGLIRQIADQIAGAISNAQLFRERRRAEEALEKKEEMARRLAQENVIMAKIGRIISSSMNIEEVYDRFAEEARKLIPFERISINLLSEDRSTYFIPYVSGAPVPGRQPGDIYPAEASLSEDMLKHGTGIILNLEEGEEMLTRFPGLRPSFEAGFRSSLRVPLVSKGQAFGIMGIHFKTTNFYTDHHLKLAESIAGQISGAIANARLFSEQLKAERELIESKQLLENVTHGITDSVMLISADFKILWANRAVLEKYGYANLEEIRGNYCYKVTHHLEIPCNSPSDPCPFQEALRTGKPVNLLHTHYDKEGNRIFDEVTANPIKDEKGGISRFVHVSKDVTKQRILEGQLAQAHKLEAIGQLAAGIAHEINTPIQYVGDNTRFFKDAFRNLNLIFQKYEHLRQAIQSGVGTDGLVEEIQTLYQKVDPDYLVKEIPKAITQTLEGVDRVANIVRAMKEFSHPGTKEKAAVNLNRAIENTITVARNEWKYVADMQTDLDPSLSLVPCLAGEINQVILNMIINAAHAIADALGNPPAGKGQITIRTCHDDRFAEVRISDTGTGIPPEIQKRIFDPFFTTKQVGKGSGQGLAIAYSVIVKKHGGSIHFETAVGQGTTFIIRLPLTPGSEAESHSPGNSG